MGLIKKHRLAAGAAVGLLISPLSAAPLDSLAKKLAAGAASLENKKIAVLTFPYHDEKISSGSTLVSERLTTCLVEHKELRVLERSLLGELLKEKRLTETGVIDPRSLKAIGKILDADAIVTGTLIDLPNDKTEINARLIRTDTGEVLAAGQVTIDRAWTDAPCEIIKRCPAPNHAVAPQRGADTRADAVDDAPSVEKSGKTLQLSNENFPMSRRRYFVNETVHPVRKNPASPFPYQATPGYSARSSDDDDDDDNQDIYMPAPVRRNYYGPYQGRGYNGTGPTSLPSVNLRSRGIGVIRYENQTITLPTTTGSSK